jgi:hypothetical protein
MAAGVFSGPLPCIHRPDAARAARPFTRAELDRFLAQAPAFMAWLEFQGASLGDFRSPAIWRDKGLMEEISIYARINGWHSGRFLYVLSHVMQGLNHSDPDDVLISRLESHLDMVWANPDISDQMRETIMSSLEEELERARNPEDSGIPRQEMVLIRDRQEIILDFIEGGGHRAIVGNDAPYAAGGS